MFDFKMLGLEMACGNALTSTSSSIVAGPSGIRAGNCVGNIGNEGVEMRFVGAKILIFFSNFLKRRWRMCDTFCLLP